MCLVLLAYEAHPAYRLILAANRDEFYERPTAPAAFWEDAPDVLAGRDLLHGGTWLGVTRAGRVAAVTNFRDPRSKRDGALSRGLLVGDFLRGGQTPGAYLAGLAPRGGDYNGFNLLAGDASGFYYYSNREGVPRELKPGVYGLSNHLLDTPWPKVGRVKEAAAAAIEALAGMADGRGGALAPETFFDILAERAQAADERLPDTGVGLEVERMLSPLFIVSPAYGTRSSTVVLVGREGRVTFAERTHGAGGGSTDVRYEFDLQTTDGRA